MTWDVLTQALTILPATIAAIASLVVAIKSRRDSKKDLIVIHDLVNSNLKKVKDSLEIALVEIQRLRGNPP